MKSIQMNAIECTLHLLSLPSYHPCSLPLPRFQLIVRFCLASCFGMFVTLAGFLVAQLQYHHWLIPIVSHTCLRGPLAILFVIVVIPKPQILENCWRRPARCIKSTT